MPCCGLSGVSIGRKAIVPTGTILPLTVRHGGQSVCLQDSSDVDLNKSEKKEPGTGVSTYNNGFGPTYA